MTYASSNALASVASGTPPPKARIGASVAPPPRKLGVIDRLGDHVEVVPASRDGIDWALAVFCDHVGAIEGPILARTHMEAMARMLRSDIARCLVAVPRGYPDDLVGWIAYVPEGALFCYVRRRFRGDRIGTALVRSVSPEYPVPLAYWTADAANSAAHGWPAKFSPAPYAALLSFTRKGYR